MKILQIATLVTPDGAYGGPIRVAVNQTRALLEAGHDVQLAASAHGFDGSLPVSFDGIPIKLFPARFIPKMGFAGTFSPSLHAWLRKELKKVDVVHIHMGRDFVTLPAARLAAHSQKPYVLQTHGMVVPSSHPLAVPIDALWSRPALRRAGKILYLTDTERIGLSSLDPSELNLQHLPNGVPQLDERPEVSEVVEVLFLARLHARKRPLVFIEMAKRLTRQFPSVRFVIVGPDEGEGIAVRTAIAASGMKHLLSWEGPVEPHEAAQRIARSTIYVLPSVNEPFPMSVLEAMSLGRPVVVTDTCGLAGPISTAAAGAVAGEDLDSLTAAVASLLRSPQKRELAARNAQQLAREKFAMPGIVQQLCGLYEGVVQDQKK